MLSLILNFIILSYTLITNQVASIITFKFVPETKVADTQMSNNYWDCVGGPRILDDDKESVAVYLDDVWMINEEIVSNNFERHLNKNAFYLTCLPSSCRNFL